MPDWNDYPLRALSEMLLKLNRSKLWLKVLIGLSLGILFGILLGPEIQITSKENAEIITNWLAFPGQLFLKLVKMIVIPLVFSSIIVGIVTSGNPDFIRRIGPRLMLFILLTTSIAIFIGFASGYSILPGRFIDPEFAASVSNSENVSSALQSGKESEFNENLPARIVNLLPDNPLEAMVSGEMLGIVLFTLILGIALLSIPTDKLQPVISILNIVQESCMIIVRWAMELAPFAVFGLMTKLTSELGFDTLSGLGLYIVAVLSGLLAMQIVYILIVWLFGGISPKKFLKTSREVLLLSFSTSSSAAVMPLSMKTLEEGLGIQEEISRFFIPVGATINMAGTALYQSVAAIFLSQVFGVELSINNLIMIVAITVGASIGTPSAPGVGIVILASILESVGIPASGVALILGVDRLLDMIRTAVNISGDATVSCIVGKSENAFDKEVFMQD